VHSFGIQVTGGVLLTMPDVEGSVATLMPTWPNPTSGRTTLDFFLRLAGNVDATVFDTAGRQVSRLASGPRAAGHHEIAWDGLWQDGTRVPPGVYYIRLRTHETVSSRSVVVME